MYKQVERQRREASRTEGEMTKGFSGVTMQGGGMEGLRRGQRLNSRRRLGWVGGAGSRGEEEC